MDRRRLKILSAALAVAFSLIHPAHAGLRNDVPSCYAANRIAPADHLGYSRLIYVLIDQTVGWNAELEQAILDNLDANLTLGTKFVIAEFSAFSQGRYLDVVDTGVIENPMPEDQTNNTPIERTRIFDACLAGQRPFAIGLANRGVQSALRQSTGSLDHSDIMAALQSVSGAIAADPAPAKLLFLASDGLENSAITSFYRHGGPRDINPQVEISRAAEAGMFGNFGGAKVYVIGGALPDPTERSDYRSPEMLQDLEKFWQIYFRKSDAILIEFGEPALLLPVQF